MAAGAKSHGIGKALLIAISVLLLLASILTRGEWWERALTAGGFSIAFLVVAILSRRFKRFCPEAPDACHIAAAVALTLGVGTVLPGAGHSIGVVSLALREGEYGPLQILRFTTGAMLLYSGAMNIGMYRAIRAGQRWGIAVATATSFLFWLYLLFLLPLPGTGTVRRILGAWSAYLVWLGAALLATRRGHATARLSHNARP